MKALLTLLVAAFVQADGVALVGGRVVTLAGPPIENGTVLLSDGKIVLVSAGRPDVGQAEIVDCSGKTVTPGLIAADTRIGTVEIDAEPSTRDYAVSESERLEDENHAAFRVASAVNPRSTLIPVARLEGITSTISAPSRGLIAGQSAWLDLGPPDLDRTLIRRSLAMHAYLGQAGSNATGGSRGWAWMRLREMLDDAKTYAASKALFERNQFRALSGSRLDLEALAPVLRREVPLAIHADREADLIAALELARETSLRVVIVGGAEAWRLARKIAQAGIPILVDPSDNLPGSFDTLGSRLDNAQLLNAAGVRVAITLRGDSHNARTLRQLAGIAASHGLPAEVALAAASRNVSQAFGMDGAYGTLEPGKTANLVVWSGDPLELSTRVEQVFVQGQRMPMTSRQTELRERYRSLK